jgi:predicted phage terminase large subunit-like protein
VALTSFRTFVDSAGLQVGRKSVWTPYPYQVPPPGEWDTWLLLGGRGAGKTEAGARYVLEHLETLGRNARVGIGAPTFADVRDVCAEGPSGLLTIGGDAFTYNRSTATARHRLGGYVRFMSAEEPGRWNGPQWTLLWADELALWKEETWHQAQFGVRLGRTPRVIVTTTPKARQFVKELAEQKGTVTTHGTTYQNTALAGRVMSRLEERYAGTRLGRQELLGEFVGDVEGALWQSEWIDEGRVAEPPTTLNDDNERVFDLPRVVIAVDPAVTANAESDETGIAVSGLGGDGEYYVLGIHGYRLPPQQWALKALELYDQWQADKIVAEVNNGGDMVVETINRACEGLGRTANVEAIRASRGKTVRAEPVAALYEQGRVHHVGVFDEAEEQMCSFPIANEHDDLVDALVYTLSDLSNQGLPNIRFL